MIESNDGGANITFDGGKSFSTIMNQPTAQFYRVVTDQDFPYHIYGAQQDNTTVEISSRSNNGSITESDWHEVGGGESGWIAPDPPTPVMSMPVPTTACSPATTTKPDPLRNVNASGQITPWVGRRSDEVPLPVELPSPLLPMESKAASTRARMSVWPPRDEGQHWKAISPDLTRDDKSKQGPVGGPITKDNTAVEYYDTIFTIDESTVEKGVIWVGSDDGLIHLTRDGGKSWTNVTPKDFPDFIRVNCIAASPLDAGTAYVAATMYLSDDFRPFLYKTKDYGKTWTKITNGIPADDFTRTIRPDTKMKGLLFAGTEAHLYVSYNDGANWIPFQLNLPNVPMTDLTIQKREDDLIVATQGRGFYVLDDLGSHPRVGARKTARGPHLFEPKANIPLCRRRRRLRETLADRRKEPSQWRGRLLLPQNQAHLRRRPQVH